MGNLGCCCQGQPPDTLTKELNTRNNSGEDEVIAFDASAATPSTKGVNTSDPGMSEEEDRKRLAAQKGQARRQAVAAQGMSAGEVRDFVKPVYAKDAESNAAIKKILKTNEKMQVLSGHLGDAALNDIVNAFQDVKKSKGEEVIRQGEEGDCLYIIKSGIVDVFVARPGPDGKLPAGCGPKVVSLESGAMFGELALMYSAPRAASVCIASPSCELWQLDREPFKMLLAQSNQNQYTLYEGWLSDVALLKSLNRYELSRLSELLESTLFDTGEEIITQGEPGDKFYILEDGTCAAYMTGTQGERKVAEYTSPGEYFGEVALLTSEPRKATIRATGEGCTVLSLSQEDFMLILGPIQDILKNDLSKYKQYAQYLC
mmetsp:Transcript_58012/g.123237  ORF Transcript_58012/g.123237 Transcript_58012/m.123237 type:complete len:373 (-) Transcript_58012:520-1638(-)